MARNPLPTRKGETMGESFRQDRRRAVRDSGPARFLPGTSIELVREIRIRRPPQHVLFDFDGTLSLIREGWQRVMIPMMVEFLLETGTGESAAELERIVRGFVAELTGKQTIYQMIRLSEEIRKRGGRPRDPLAYKRIYHDRLMEKIRDRREGLRSGRIPPETMLVPGSLQILQNLAERGTGLYLASGTDERYVREEAALLGLDRWFGDHLYGAVDDYRSYSKADVIRRILEMNRIDGAGLLGFGDGYVEIRNLRDAGGIAVAVASDESGRSGKPDPWKRKRLIAVGADVVIPDYRDHRPLLDLLFRTGDPADAAPEGREPPS